MPKNSISSFNSLRKVSDMLEEEAKKMEDKLDHVKKIMELEK